MQFGLQVERQEFGTLGFHNWNILQGNHILKLLCFFIRDILVFRMILMKKTEKEEQDVFPVPLCLLVAKHFS